MQEFIPNICDVSDEEITQVRRRPAEVTALRKQVYLVVSDRLDDGIREIESPPDKSITLESKQANEYFTYDLSSAAVRYAELVTASRETSPSGNDSGADEIIFIDEPVNDLGLSPAEQDFFQ